MPPATRNRPRGSGPPLHRDLYRQDDRNPFRWFRLVLINDQEIEVELDFLAPDDGLSHRHVRVGDELVARNAAGGQLVREQNETRELTGTLPDGRENTVRVRVVGPAALIGLKALALDGRDRLKDSYDIDYVLAHVEGGIDAVVDSLLAMAHLPIVGRIIEILDEKFRTVDAIGPVSVARYRQLTGEDADRARAAAFARVRTLITQFRESALSQT